MPPSSICQRPNCRHRGSVLIVAVWTLAILTVIAVGLGVRCSFALGVAQRWKQQFVASQAAESVVQYALTQFKFDATPGVDGPKEEWCRLLGYSAPEEIEVDFGPGLVGEELKLNLNNASVKMLYNLLTRLGVREAQAQDVSESIVDWRDEDTDEHDHGAERYYYTNLTPSYACKDAPFDSIEELLLVKGMTPDLFKAMRPYVTVFGGPLNLNAAEPFMLKTLGISDQAIDGILTYRVGEDGVAGTSDDQLFSSPQNVPEELGGLISEEDRVVLTRAVQEGVIGVQFQEYALSVFAETAGSRSKMKVWCVLNRAGEVKAWHEE